MQKVFILGIVVVWGVPAVSAQARKAPELTLKDLRGRNVHLSNYKGKVLLLNFWATWCPPCRAEMRDLVTWQKENRSLGLQVIGVTYPPTSRSEVRRFVRRIKVNYPIVLGTKKTKALFDKSETLPITVVIDREGNIRETIEGILLAEEFAERIRPLLVQSSRQNAHQTPLKKSYCSDN